MTLVFVAAILVVGGLLLAGTRPGVLAVAMFALPQLGLLATVAGVPNEYLWFGSLALALLVIFVARPAGPPRGTDARWILGGTIALGIVGTISAWGDVPEAQILQGVRLLLSPVILAIAVSRLRPAEVGFLLKGLTIVLFASAFASVVEAQIGVDRLVAGGLEYGTNVRTFDSRLRAPGLALTNFELGSFAGVMGALALTWWKSLPSDRPSERWRWLCVASSLVALFETSLRSGLVVIVVASLAVVVSGGSRLGARVAVGASAILLGLVTWTLGLASTESLSLRFQLWEAIGQSYGYPWFGHGLGFAGAASNSRFATSRVVTDNYFILLLLEFGLLAVVAATLFAVKVVRIVSEAKSSRMMLSACTLLGVIAACSVAEFWEYTAATGLALGMVLFSQASVSGRRLSGPALKSKVF